MKRGQSQLIKKFTYTFMRRLKILTSKKRNNSSMAEDFHFNMVQLASVSSVVLSLALGYIIHQLTVCIDYKSTRRMRKKKSFFFSVAAVYCVVRDGSTLDFLSISHRSLIWIQVSLNFSSQSNILKSQT